MLRRAMCRSIGAIIVAVGVLGVPAAPALADSAPPASVKSNFENTYGASLSRDCGFSTPLPANPATSLWLFCDTAIYGLNQQLQYHLTGFIPGSTAAEGPYTAGEVPQGSRAANAAGRAAHDSQQRRAGAVPEDSGRPCDLHRAAL